MRGLSVLALALLLVTGIYFDLRRMRRAIALRQTARAQTRCPYCQGKRT